MPSQFRWAKDDTMADCPHCGGTLTNVAEQACPHCHQLLRSTPEGAAPDGQPTPMPDEFPSATMAEEKPDSDPFLSATFQTMESLWSESIEQGMDEGMTIKRTARTQGRWDRLALRERVLLQTDQPLDTDPDFELRGILGRGGMGVVYEARQTSIDRILAVKMIRREAAGHPDHRSKFLSEAAVIGDLDHPNIVPIYDLGTDQDGQLFYAMKKVKGTPWSEVLHDKPLNENLGLLQRVCDAVAYAHSKGDIHRDLKPENVMLGEFGEVLLMDWGMAASVTEAGRAEPIVDAAAIGGTPAYMAPEMASGDYRLIGPHSDVYLLGAILYEIITGKRPHTGTTMIHCLTNAQLNVIQPTDETGELVEIARKAMATDPDDRYEDVKVFQGAIRDYQSHAESVDLARRGHEALQAADDSGDYDDYARAIFGFQQAMELWEGNEDARRTEIEARRRYAEAALAKGDLDLGRSLLLSDQPEHADLRERIEKALQEQQARQRRLRRLTYGVVGLVTIVILVLSVASYLIYGAMQAEAEQRDLAERERRTAEEQRREAQEALAAMKAAQEAERLAEEEKVAAERELQKSGMLMDNSWWTFSREEAQRRQREAAAELGLPVRRRLEIPAAQDLDFRLIPPGVFVMGSNPKEKMRSSEEHLHRVEITKPFYMAVQELTQEQWAALVERRRTEEKGGGPRPNLPFAGASWEEIRTQLLPALQSVAPPGWRLGLPTEAQWEYACRAGTATPFHGGDSVEELPALGWHLANSGDRLHPPRQRTPNAWGLYDLHGNVAEICRDEYATNVYLQSPEEDPVLLGQGEFRVVRGGSFRHLAEHCRSAYRSYVHRENRHPTVGVRLVLVPERDPELQDRPE